MLRVANHGIEKATPSPPSPKVPKKTKNSTITFVDTFKQKTPAQMATMEYRLLQFHWEGTMCDCPNAGVPLYLYPPTANHVLKRLPITTEARSWHITSASEDGIPLSNAPIPNTFDDFLDLGPKRYAFLAKALGRGGRWEGWYENAEFPIMLVRGTMEKADDCW